MSQKLIVGAIMGAAMALSGCSGALSPAGPSGAASMQNPAAEVTARQVSLPTELPPMKAFGRASTRGPARPNGEIATDFLDLAFELESGRQLPVLTRFEGPITLKLTGRGSSVLENDLTRLLARLNDEAGIAITRNDSAARPSITLQVITRRQLQGAVPGAACFVAPNVSSWSEYRTSGGQERTDWTRLTTRTRMAIFIPGDVAPQEMRDCLHEEIAQALGPVNDLYRLSDSVFNDDNFHTVLTGFDMLVLRAYYAPELRSGMTRTEVAARLPAILARLNPEGGLGSPSPRPDTPEAWKQAIAMALGGSGTTTERRAAAGRAVDIARAQGWRDTRLAFSLFALGRLNLGLNSDVALASFREAEAIYRANPQNGLQAAHMGVQLAAHALSLGNAETAIRIVDGHLRPVQAAENAALLATFLMIKAEALVLLGRDREAQLVRLDSLGWARYGFGSEEEVGARLFEIAAISPLNR